MALYCMYSELVLRGYLIYYSHAITFLIGLILEARAKICQILPFIFWEIQ